MAQQETYGNWLGPERLRRQPGIYSVASKMSPVGDFRPASPDSFEDDYDDVSMAGSDRGPPGKGVYLLAGPPGSSRSPAPSDPEDLELKSPKSIPDLEANSPDPDPNSRNSEGRGGNLRNFWNSVAVLALLLALGALGWAGILAAALGKQAETRAELELLKSNLSKIWDLVQQDQILLQFGIHQHQEELQELSERPCGAPGSSRRCSAGWLSFGPSCFSFSRRSLSWLAARNACADLGAHLAVVGSEQEQEFLLDNIERSVSYWLGMTDAEQEGKWRWVTGEVLDIGFWDVWLHDPHKEQKDCGALGPKGLWVSEHCWRALRWVCERPAEC